MLNLHCHYSTLKTRLFQLELKQYFLLIVGFYFIVAMHYFQQNHGGMALSTPFNPLGWVVISALIALGIIQIAHSKKLLYTPFVTAITIACCLLLVPLIYAPGTGWYSHQRLLGLFAGLAVLIAIIQFELTSADFEKLLKFILIATLIESTFSLIQFYILPSQSLININSRRPSAIFFQANVAASFFATGLLISLYLRQRLSDNLRKNLNQAPTKLYSLLINTVPVVTTMAIVLLQSRTGFVAVVIGSLLLLMPRHGVANPDVNQPSINKPSVNKDWLNKLSVNKQWLALVLLGITLAVSSLALLERHTRGAEVYSEAGLRSEIYRDSIELITQQPLLGHGYGRFRRAYHQLQADKYRSDPSYPPQYRMSHPHNEPLLWLVEGGAVALIAMLIIAAAFIYAIGRQRSNWPIKFALLFPLSLHTMTEFPFYSSVASWLTFLLITAYIARQPAKERVIRIDNPIIFKALALVLFVVTTVQMTSLLISQKIITQVVISQDSSPLLATSLPLVSVDFEQVLIETQLQIAIENQLPQTIELYITWARQQIAVMPVPQHYSNLILAYLYLQQISAANLILSEAQALFPSLDWQESVAHITAAQQLFQQP